MTTRTLRFLILCSLSGALSAQDLLPTPRFPDASYFRQTFNREIPKVDLLPPARLQDFVANGKLELSLRSYIDLVLANNTEMQVTRLSVETFRNNITRAFGRFDPVVTTSFTATRDTQQSTSVLEGATNPSSLSQPFRFSYDQLLDSGTRYSVGFNALKSSSNNAFATFNPAITSNFQINFTQPLLRDRGRYINRLQIAVARSRFRQSEYNTQDNLLRLLQFAETAYWNVIDARESLRVQEGGLKVASEILERNKKELQLGAISALDIFQPQQSYATQEVAVTTARYRLQQTEDALRRQIGADLDPSFRNMPIELTESVLPPTDDRPLDREAHVELAYRHRPDLKSTLQALDIDDLTYKQAQNRLLPDFALTGTYNSKGLGGNFIPRTNDLGTGVRLTNQLIPGGLGDALENVFAFRFPTYTMGITLRLPLRDRAAQADLADATVNKRLNALRARSAEQTIRQDVLNAVTDVESARASVRLAGVALDFAQKRLDAENKKYELGLLTIFFLVQAQQDLVRAQADLVSNSVRYRRSQLNLLRMTGTLLEERGVALQ